MIGQCMGYPGCLPFSQKIRKFRFEVKWKGNFPENLFANCGQPPEVVLFFRSEWNSGNALRPFVRIIPFPGPFSQDRENMRDGMQSSKMVSAILIRLVNKLNSENRLPLCNDDSIRIIWLNGKHPRSLISSSLAPSWRS